MKINLLKTLVMSAAFLFVGGYAQGQMVDLTQRLHYKNYIDNNFSLIQTKYLSAFKQEKIKAFIAQDSMVQSTRNFRSEMIWVVQSVEYLNALTYIDFKLSANGLSAEKKEHYINEINQLLEQYFIEKRLALEEIVTDPRYQKKPKSFLWFSAPSVAEKVNVWIKKIGNMEQYLWHVRSMEGCISNSLLQSKNRAYQLRYCADINIPRVDKIHPERTADGFNTVSFARIDLGLEIDFYPGGVISRTGFIPGNKVTAINRNRSTYDREFMKTIEKNYTEIVDQYAKRWAPYSDSQMIDQMAAIISESEKNGKNPIFQVFNEGKESAVLTVQGNPIWQYYYDVNDKNMRRENQIFPRIVETIRSAQSTIFADLFFWGGTMGIALTNEIINILNAKPNVKLFMVRDEINHFGHRDEMRPVFNFLRAYMKVHPTRALILPSYIQENVSGFPLFVDALLSDDLFGDIGSNLNLNLYYKAKSDHSKVIVVDGDQLQGHPMAIVGSKNITDASGAVCNDEALLIEGPAAVVILDNYWRDMYRSLKNEVFRKDTELNVLYNSVLNQGWAKDFTIGEEATTLDKVRRALAPIDILKRYQKSSIEVDVQEKVVARALGTELVRIGENSVGSTIVSARNQNLAAIMRAQYQILMNDQYFYDTYLIDAVIKKSKEGVAVKMILEGFIGPQSTTPGMPNIVYLESLKKAGIEVKWFDHAGSDVFVPEHHGKTISVDGYDVDGKKVGDGMQVLIEGSANKDYLTMKGAFRETQVEVFDSEAQLIHDEQFWHRWENKSKEASTDEFKQSKMGQDITSRGFSVEEVLARVRDFAYIMYSLETITISE